MLFKGIHLKYLLLCSRRKPPKGMQTRAFRNAPRCKCRLCSSFPHSFGLQTWRLPAGDLCSAQQPPADAMPPIHAQPASLSLCPVFPLLPSIHPVCFLICSDSIDPPQEYSLSSHIKAPAITMEGRQQLYASRKVCLGHLSKLMPL